MTRLRSLCLALPLLALGAFGCATPTSDSESDSSEHIAHVAQAYEVGESDVMYHITWYADDADPPNSPDDPLIWTADAVAPNCGLIDYQLELTAGPRGKKMIITPDKDGALAFSTYLATVPVPPIGSRIELTIGDPGRRW